MTGWNCRADSPEGVARRRPLLSSGANRKGPMSQLIWAPEMHRINGKWYIYFAATILKRLISWECSSTACLPERGADADPLTGKWDGAVRLNTV